MFGLRVGNEFNQLQAYNPVFQKKRTDSDEYQWNISRMKITSTSLNGEFAYPTCTSFSLKYGVAWLQLLLQKLPLLLLAS